jgi:hypothetical protein
LGIVVLTIFIQAANTLSELFVICKKFARLILTTREAIILSSAGRPWGAV